MMTALLIVHGLLAILLLGAVTHQAASVLWPLRNAGPDRSFIARFRAVSGGHYTTAVIVLFLVTFAIGSVIYPAYRLNVRTYLQDYRMFPAEGAFEIKEHFAAIALMLLPLYWYLWTRTPGRAAGAAVTEARGGVDSERAFAVSRAAVTAMICLAAWTSFFVGHILNNIRGLFGT